MNTCSKSGVWFVWAPTTLRWLSTFLCLTYIILWHTYSVLYEVNLANLPGYCQLGWTQDWLCIFVSVPAPQHSVLKACESGLYDED